MQTGGSACQEPSTNRGEETEVDVEAQVAKWDEKESSGHLWYSGMGTSRATEPYTENGHYNT